MDISEGSPKNRHEDHDVSDAESSSGASVKSGASSLLSRRSQGRSGLSITSKGAAEDLKTYRDLLLSKGYSITGIIGRGQNSGFVVHSAVKNGEKFAVKVSTENEEEGTNGDALRREYAVLSRLSHENIVKAYNIWRGHVDEGIKGSAMVLEFCPGSTLNRSLPYTSPSATVGNMAWRRSCLKQIATAVAHLHSLGLAHRDLHSKNVVINFSSADGGSEGYPTDERTKSEPSASSVVTVKVVDFGCAGPLSSERSVEEDVNVNILPVGSTQPCDVFALGLLGVSLFAGKEMSSWSVVPADGGQSTLRLPPCGLKGYRLTKIFEEYLLGLLNVEFANRFKAQDAVDKIPEETQWVMTKKLSL